MGEPDALPLPEPFLSHGVPGCPETLFSQHLFPISRGIPLTTVGGQHHWDTATALPYQFISVSIQFVCKEPWPPLAWWCYASDPSTRKAEAGGPLGVLGQLGQHRETPCLGGGRDLKKRKHRWIDSLVLGIYLSQSICFNIFIDIQSHLWAIKIVGEKAT